ncbi:MAG TPA: DUF6695 family protein [Flavobacteriales bacterium]|nr:DUF6695 family protein [Flavobacteriales bacterium]
MLKTDFIITLAWPEGEILSVGSWYDNILGENRKYKIGHTALLSVNSETKIISYYDFGRYHSPIGFGRIRDFETDPDLRLDIKATIKNNSILNLSEIISNISENKSTHGEGTLYYKVIRNVNLTTSKFFAKQKQDEGIISFGPFSEKSLNCGRFVYQFIRKSRCKKSDYYKVILNDFLLRIPFLKKFSIKYYFK